MNTVCLSVGWWVLSRGSDSSESEAKVNTNPVQPAQVAIVCTSSHRRATFRYRFAHMCEVRAVLFKQLVKHVLRRRDNLIQANLLAALWEASALDRMRWKARHEHLHLSFLHLPGHRLPCDRIGRLSTLTLELRGFAMKPCVQTIYRTHHHHSSQDT